MQHITQIQTELKHSTRPTCHLVAPILHCELLLSMAQHNYNNIFHILSDKKIDTRDRQNPPKMEFYLYLGSLHK